MPGRKVLADLLPAAMQVADVRRHFGDHLAVGPQHQPQHPVRAGMLRPHVDQHLVAAQVEFDQLGIHVLRRQALSPRDPVVLGGRLVIFAQRVAGPVLGQQDAAQVGVTGEKMPDRSKTSRSCQSAVAQTWLTVGTSGNRPSTSSCQRGSMTFSTSRCRWTRLERW